MVSEYEKAYNTYQKALIKDKASNAASNEAFATAIMTGLMLCGGSVLGALVGTTCLKTATGNGALKLLNGPVLDYIVKKNSEKMFSVAHWAASNPVAFFIAGKGYDQLEAVLSNKLKAEIKSSGAITKNATKGAAKPGEMARNLKAMVNEMGALANKAVLEVTTKQNRVALINQVRKSPFLKCIPDLRGKDERSAIYNRCLLSIWMHHILTLDQRNIYIFRNFERSFGFFPDTTLTRNVPQMPSSSSYPAARSTSQTQDRLGYFGTIRTLETITYRDTGTNADKSIRAAHKNVYKSDFFANAAWYNKSKRHIPKAVDKSALVKAEAVLKRLAVDNSAILANKLALAR